MVHILLNGYMNARSMKVDPVADRLGISRAALYALKAGETTPNMEVADKIAEMLDNGLTGKQIRDATKMYKAVVSLKEQGWSIAESCSILEDVYSLELYVNSEDN